MCFMAHVVPQGRGSQCIPLPPPSAPTVTLRPPPMPSANWQLHRRQRLQLAASRHTISLYAQMRTDNHVHGPCTCWTAGDMPDLLLQLRSVDAVIMAHHIV